MIDLYIIESKMFHRESDWKIENTADIIHNFKNYVNTNIGNTIIFVNIIIRIN